MICVLYCDNKGDTKSFDSSGTIKGEDIGKSQFFSFLLVDDDIYQSVHM